MEKTLTTMDRIRRMSEDERQKMAEEVCQSLSKRFSNAMPTIGMNLEEGFIDAASIGLSDLETAREGAINRRGEEDCF